ncbi:MAG: SufE family protein [Candidatus Shikimatogenerans bostrichidophilus]|nr:MAG: SufE family protein [Candidatus Shikimatogenerans bostrichidophilus]
MKFENKIINKFNKIKNKNNLYLYLIKKGKKLPNYPLKYKNKLFLFKNCQIKVWLYMKYINKKFYLIGKSESNIINGIIFLIINLFKNKTPFNIINYDDNKFFNKINLIEILSFNKYNLIINIIKKIKKFTFKKLK